MRPRSAMTSYGSGLSFVLEVRRVWGSHTSNDTVVTAWSALDLSAALTLHRPGSFGADEDPRTRYPLRCPERRWYLHTVLSTLFIKRLLRDCISKMLRD